MDSQEIADINDTLPWPAALSSPPLPTLSVCWPFSAWLPSSCYDFSTQGLLTLNQNTPAETLSPHLSCPETVYRLFFIQIIKNILTFLIMGLYSHLCIGI